LVKEDLMRRALPILLLLAGSFHQGAGPQSPSVLAGDAETSATVVAKCKELLTSSRFVEARSFAERASRRDPNNPMLHYLLAIAHSNLRDPRKACLAYDRALANGYRAATVFGERGSARRLIGDLSGALADLDKAINSEPETPEWYLERALAYRNSGKLREADRDVESARKWSKSDRPTQQRILGRLYVKVGDYPQALKCLTEAARSSDGRAATLAARGNLHELMGDRVKALRDYDESIRLDPADPQSRMERGMIHDAEARYREATADFERAIERGHPFALLVLSQLLSTCPDAAIRDGKRAVQLATKACEATDFEDPKGLEVLACAYAEAGQWKEAVRWVETALKMVEGGERNGCDTLWCELELYRDRKAYRVWTAKDVKGKPPSSGVDSLLVAFSKQRAGDDQGYIDELHRAIRLDPTLVGAHRLLASLSSKRGDKRGAIRHYTTCLKLDPKNVLALAGRAEVYVNLGQPEDALTDADAALKIAPKHISALGLRMLALIALDKKDTAIGELNTLIQKHPKAGGLYFLRGYGLFNLGRYKEAIPSLTKAIEYNSDDAWAYSLRAIARARLGEKEEAKRYLQECARLNPTFREYTEAMMER
jgi:tetratricopeptide (TPR) repeat protein